MLAAVAAAPEGTTISHSPNLIDCAEKDKVGRKTKGRIPKELAAGGLLNN